MYGQIHWGKKRLYSISQNFLLTSSAFSYSVSPLIVMQCPPLPLLPGPSPGLYMCAYPEHLLYIPPEPFVESGAVLGREGCPL